MGGGMARIVVDSGHGGLSEEPEGKKDRGTEPGGPEGKNPIGEPLSRHTYNLTARLSNAAARMRSKPGTCNPPNENYLTERAFTLG